MKKRTLVLHVGIHKTGSTSLQQFLYENRGKLQESGWDYFCNDRAGYVNPDANINPWFDESGVKDSFQLKLNRAIYKQIEGTVGNVIISAEHFSWVFSEREWGRVIGKLYKIFDVIKIVWYLRRQDFQLTSNYQQGFKFRESTSARFFGRELIAMPKYKSYFDKYLNYFDRHNLYERLVGKENVITLPYCHLERRDIIQDFVDSIFGCSVNGLIPVYRSDNKSLNKWQIFLSYYLVNFMTRTGVAYCNKLLNWHKQKFLPMRFEAEFILEQYKESNRKLADKLKLNSVTEIFDVTDFSMYD